MSGKLTKKEEKEIEKLIKQLKDEDKDVRGSAIWALGRIGEKAEKAVPALIEALKDKAEAVRSGAAQALGRFDEKAEKVVPALIEALKDEAEDVRDSAVWALLGIGEKAVPALIEALKDEAVHRRAIWALGRMGEKAEKAVHALIETLKDEAVCWGAAYALGAIGEKAVPSLKEAMKSDIKIVREQAIIALETISAKLGYHNHKDYLRASMTDEELRAETIGKYIDQLDSLNLQKRKVAVYKLGEMHAKEAIESFERLLNKRRENTWLRAFIVWALGEIGTDKAIRILKIMEKPKELVGYVIMGALVKLDEEYRKKISPEDKKEIEFYEAELYKEAKKVILSPPRESWFVRKGIGLLTAAIVEGLALIGMILGLILK